MKKLILEKKIFGKTNKQIIDNKRTFGIKCPQRILSSRFSRKTAVAKIKLISQ